MRKTLKLFIGIIITFVVVSFISRTKVEAAIGDVVSNQIVTAESEGVGIEFTGTAQKFNNLYVYGEFSTYRYYSFIGQGYDSTHEYTVEVINEHPETTTAYDTFDFVQNFIVENSYQRILCMLESFKQGQYNIELKITDRTENIEYYQTIPYYTEVSEFYYVLATGGTRYIEETQTEEPVVFDHAYLLNNETFELTDRTVDVDGTSVLASTLTSLDIEIVQPSNSNYTINNVYVSLSNDECSYIPTEGDPLKFTISWPHDNLSPEIFENTVSLYLAYENTTTSVGYTTIQSFTLVNRQSQDYMVDFTIYADPNPENMYQYAIISEKDKRYDYDLFVIEEDINFTLDTLINYSYTSLYAVYNNGFMIDINGTYSLTMPTLITSLGLGEPANGYYYLYFVAKDVKGSPIGIEKVPVKFDLVEIQETTNIEEVINLINDLDTTLSSESLLNYTNYGSLFKEIDELLNSIKLSSYKYIENYDLYLEYKQKCDYAWECLDLDRSFELINGYSKAYLVNNDSTLIDTYDRYTKLPVAFQAEITQKEGLGKLLDYIKCRDEILLFTSSVNDYANNAESNFNAAYEVYQQYKNLDSNEMQYVSNSLLSIIYDVREVLEKSISGISFQSGDQVNLLLGDSDENSYFLGLDEAFVKSNLMCQWIIIGDTIFNYETSSTGITIYPSEVGECKVLVYYETLDGQVYSDEIKVSILQDKIEANILISKDSEGSYTIYDTLFFQVQLSYAFEFSNYARYVWSINGEEVAYTPTLEYQFKSADTYTIECVVSDTLNGLESTSSTRNIRIISVSDADFTMSMNYQDKIYAYLGGNEIILESLLDDYLNNDYTYEWRILDETIVTFFLQNPTGPQIALRPLKNGVTSVVVMVDVGKYQPKILMCSLEIEVISVIESVELYRVDSGLRPNSNVVYRASINQIENVVNLNVSFSVEYAEDAQYTPTEVKENELILNDLNNGRYNVYASIDGQSTSDTFRIQTIALDQVLYSALPIFAVIAFSLLVVKIIYDKKKSKLLVLFEKITNIKNQMNDLKEKISTDTITLKTQKLVLKNLKKWQHQLSSLFILTKNLSIQQNLELEVAEKHFMDILFIMEAGIKTFKEKFQEKTVRTYLEKLCTNNLKDLLMILEQKVKTIKLQQEKQKEDSFLSQEKETAKQKAERKKLSPKEYADYLRKIHYYDAEEADEDD